MGETEHERVRSMRERVHRASLGDAHAEQSIAPPPSREEPSEEDARKKKKREDDFDAFTSTKSQDLEQPLVPTQIPYKIHIVKDHMMKERLCSKLSSLSPRRVSSSPLLERLGLQTSSAGRTRLFTRSQDWEYTCIGRSIIFFVWIIVFSGWSAVQVRKHHRCCCYSATRMRLSASTLSSTPKWSRQPPGPKPSAD